MASEMFDTCRLSPGSAFVGVTRMPNVMHRNTKSRTFNTGARLSQTSFTMSAALYRGAQQSTFGITGLGTSADH